VHAGFPAAVARTAPPRSRGRLVAALPLPRPRKPAGGRDGARLPELQGTVTR
jgi:hypothetical protein